MIFRNDTHGVLFEKEIRLHKGCGKKFTAALFLLTADYSGLTAGKTYKISGILMDKGTGEPLEIDGQQVTAEKEFTPKSESGTVDLEYTFDASTLAGKAVVVFETLYQDDVEVTSHADIEDEGQTVAAGTAIGRADGADPLQNNH